MFTGTCTDRCLRVYGNPGVVCECLPAEDVLCHWVALVIAFEAVRQLALLPTGSCPSTADRGHVTEATGRQCLGLQWACDCCWRARVGIGVALVWARVCMGARFNARASSF